MQGDHVLYSSKSELWETPQSFFDELDREFHFGVDVCAIPENTKCKKYFSPEEDGLKQSWGGYGAIWCNPPYGRKIVDWVRKASEEAKNGNTIVMLIHARTDTRWFHDYIYQKPNVDIRFVKGRLRFNGSTNSAPFPSMVVVFRPDQEQ